MKRTLFERYQYRTLTREKLILHNYKIEQYIIIMNISVGENIHASYTMRGRGKVRTDASVNVHTMMRG